MPLVGVFVLSLQVLAEGMLIVELKRKSVAKVAEPSRHVDLLRPVFGMRRIHVSHPFILMDEKPYRISTLLGDTHIWLEIFVNMLSGIYQTTSLHEEFVT